MVWQVLGTLITEWAAGALICIEMLALEAIAQRLANQLCRIMVHYAFDGWLINIENPVVPLLLPNLLHFLRYAYHCRGDTASPALRCFGIMVRTSAFGPQTPAGTDYCMLKFGCYVATTHAQADCVQAEVCK